MSSDVSTDADDSIRGVAARINAWVSLHVEGIVWTRYVSDVSRDNALLLLERPAKRIRFEPPDSQQAGDWLEQALRKHVTADGPEVVAVLFPAVSEPKQEWLWECFRALNLRRESISGLPLIQLWWISASLSARAEMEARDLASWFRLKLRLEELPTPASLRLELNDVELLKTNEQAQRRLVEANELHSLGRREDALKATEQAVLLYRRLVAGKPDHFLPDLARSLNNVAVMRSEVGRREEALAAAEEALFIDRKLAAERPDAFLPDLATSLSNVAADLSDLGRQEEALAAAEETLTILRKLAGEKPDAFLPNLAMSLNNVAIVRSRVGLREEALGASEDAVTLYRRMAREKPDAFLPNLAMSLNNLAHRRSAVGRREEAFAAAEEAVMLYRRLAAERPEKFLPNLALSLTNSADRWGDMERWDKALAAAEEAVTIRRKLAAESPDAFIPDLARSLGTQGLYLRAANREAESLASFNEAIQLLKPCFLKLPGAFAPLMDTLARNYLEAVKRTATAPDYELLNEIQEALTHVKTEAPAR